MSIVNFQTGEIVEGETVEADLTATEARRLTDEIRQTLRVGHGLIVKAFKGRAWIALGYPTWDSYCAGEFAEARMVRLNREQRQEIVAEMRQSGMSIPAIASGIGVPKSTVGADLPVLEAQGINLPTSIRETSGRQRSAVSPGSGFTAEAREQHAQADAKPRRRPLPDVARDAGWDLRKAVERLERLAADDRFAANAEQVTPHLRSHLTNAIEVCQDLLDRINNN